MEIKLLAAREELGADVEVGVDASRGVEEDLSNVNRRRVRVVESEAVEEAGEKLDVRRHVLPEPRVVGGTSAEPELDAVAPDD